MAPCIWIGHRGTHCEILLVQYLIPVKNALVGSQGNHLLSTLIIDRGISLDQGVQVRYLFPSAGCHSIVSAMCYDHVQLWDLSGYSSRIAAL